MSEDDSNTHCEPQNIPSVLRELPVWVGWGGMRKDGKPNKAPIRLRATDEQGKHPLRVMPFEEALARTQRIARQGRWDDWGIGISAADLHRHGYGILDLDSCLDHPDALALIDECATYTECSPSGTGYHLIFRLRETGHPQGVRRFDTTGPFGHLKGEFFSSAGYCTVTGRVVGDGHHEVAVVPRWVEHALRELGSSADGPGDPVPQTRSGDVAPEHFEVDETQDRSRALYVHSLRLAEDASDADQLLSWLVNDSEAFAVAQAHWPKNPVEYLWRHHASKAYEQHLATGELTVEDLGPAEDRVDVAEGGGHLVRSMQEMTDEARAPDWVVEGLVERGELVVLSGPSSVGKSFIALDLAAHVAAGRPWCGRSTGNGGGVLYLAGEGPRGFRRRVAAFSEHRFTTGNLFFSDHLFDLSTKKGLKALVQAIRSALERMTVKLDVVFIDTLVKFFHGDENDNTIIGLLVSNLQLLTKEFGTAFIIVAHPRKDSLDGRVRGAYSLQANVDVTLIAMPVVVGEQVVPRMVELSLDIVRDAEGGFREVMELEVVDVMLGDELVTSCVVKQVGAQVVAQMDQARLTDDMFRVLEALTEEPAGVRAVQERVTGRKLKQGEVSKLLRGLEDQGLAETVRNTRKGTDEWVATLEGGRAIRLLK